MDHRLATRTRAGCLALVSIAGVFLLSSCHETDGRKTATGSLDTASDAAINPNLEQPVTVAAAPPRVTVLTEGQSPKKVVSFTDTGATQSVTVSVARHFTQNVTTVGALASSAPTGQTTGGVSAVLQAQTTKLADPQPNDPLAPQRTVTSTWTNPTQDGALETAALVSTDGFRFAWDASPAGRVETYRLTAPKKAADDGRTLTEQSLLTLASLPVIFPTKPIGTGAQWTIDIPVASDETLRQTITYTLTQLNKTTATLELTVTRAPALGTLEATAADGKKITLTVQSADTTTAPSLLKVDLTKPLPIYGDIAFTTRVVYAPSTPDDQTRIVQDTTVAVTYGAGSLTAPRAQS